MMPMMMFAFMLTIIMMRKTLMIMQVTMTIMRMRMIIPMSGLGKLLLGAIW